MGFFKDLGKSFERTVRPSNLRKNLDPIRRTKGLFDGDVRGFLDPLDKLDPMGWTKSGGSSSGGTPYGQASPIRSGTLLTTAASRRRRLNRQPVSQANTLLTKTSRSSILGRT